MGINEIVPTRECFGCMACVQICPKHALDIVTDINGFRYPRKNKDCIGCKLCEKVCPYLHGTVYFVPIKTKIALSRTKKEIKKSSSGGIFYTIAKYLIEKKKAIVYGAAFYEKTTVRHERATCINELFRMQGSKYVQSDIGYVYRDVKNDLDNNHWVLFSGTPCQVAGLHSFLQKEYSKLLTMDLICHGVSSGKLLRYDLEKTLKQNISSIKSISFRNKSWNHKTMFGIFLTKDYEHYSIKAEDSLFMSAYLNGISFREKCYTCPYAKEERCADITIGDCNISDKYFYFHPGQAVSTLLINTYKGNWIYEKCKMELYTIEHDYKEEVRANKALHQCSDKLYQRNIFFNDMNTKEYEKCKDKYLVVRRKKQYIQDKMRNIFPKQIKAVIRGIYLQLRISVDHEE